MRRTLKQQCKMPFYRLKKDIPLAKAGTVFYYDQNDSDLGSIASGCLKLAWDKKGHSQDLIIADTIVFHANAIEDKEWFELIPEKDPVFIESEVTHNGEKLYKKVIRED